MAATTSNQVYVKDKEYAWVPARVVSQNSSENSACVRIAKYKDEGSIASDGGKNAIGWEEKVIDLNDYPNKTLPVQNVKGSELVVKEDMVELPFLHEAAILYNLKARHCAALPYTRTGDIVIACNPYQWLLDLYSEKQQHRYSSTIVWEEHECDPRTLVRPHVYETSSLAYKGLLVGGINQSILVSGESGAGKTETVKICMNHIASVQNGSPNTKNKNNSASSASSQQQSSSPSSPVVERVLESNPLLEAFGNAKTRRNDNSSRFGKYIDLQFVRKERIPAMNCNRCELSGSECNVYLLEKNRVITHEEQEGTFHIFYQLLGATNQMKSNVWNDQAFQNSNYDSYKYVGKPKQKRNIEGMTDAEAFEHTCKTLSFINIVENKFKTLMDAIIITLSLGNISFDSDPSNDENSILSSKAEFETVQKLIGIDSEIFKLSLLQRTVQTRRETVNSPVNKDIAKQGCDAFAKEIYARSFLWLVREINSATSAAKNCKEHTETFATIGLLDIFGFESFPVNGYEQLCINYANEKLQQKFTRDIFEAVQQEYEAEGIDLLTIKYDDNSDVLELLEGRLGLIKLLNEECVRPRGSERAFVAKSFSSNRKTTILIHEHKYTPLEFCIHHYAGKVVYYAKDFVTKNKDTLPLDLQLASTSSTNEIINNLTVGDGKGRNKKIGSRGTSRGVPNRQKSNLTADTILTKFTKHLTTLMRDLVTTNSRYIRCLKPNVLKKTLLMQHMTTVEQLRCAGVVAAITISRSAFPNRLEHQACIERFRMFRKKGTFIEYKNDDLSNQVINLIDPILKVLEEEKKGEGSINKVYIMGITRVYFRAGALEYLEQERTKHWEKWVIELQRFIRGWLVWRYNNKRKFASRKPYAIMIQCWYRCIVAKEEFRKLQKIRKAQRKQAKRYKKAATKIQCHARGYLVRINTKEVKETIEIKTKILVLEEKFAKMEEIMVKKVKKAKVKAEKKITVYKAKIQEEMESVQPHTKKAATQKAVLDESKRAIQYLENQHMKLKVTNDYLANEHSSLREKSADLIEINTTDNKSFSVLKHHSHKISKRNVKINENIEFYKKQISTLKEDLKTREEYFIKEADARLSYQQTMKMIVEVFQDYSKNSHLVEEIVELQLECQSVEEAEKAAMSVVADNRRASAILHDAGKRARARLATED